MASPNRPVAAARRGQRSNTPILLVEASLRRIPDLYWDITAAAAWTSAGLAPARFSANGGDAPLTFKFAGKCLPAAGCLGITAEGKSMRGWLARIPTQP